MARGRPFLFSPDEALETAMRVFWSRGYEGASLNELTAAMGLSRPSVYNCFGNKETLFRQALQLYEERYLAFARDALCEGCCQTKSNSSLHDAVRSLRAGASS